MPCRTNTNVDENIERIFYKSLPFVKDALEHGDMSTQTAKKLIDNFLNRFFQKDPLAIQIMRVVLNHLKGTEDIEETVSPLEDD